MTLPIDPTQIHPEDIGEEQAICVRDTVSAHWSPGL